MHRAAIAALLALLLASPAFGDEASDLKTLVAPDGQAEGDYDRVMNALAGVVERNAKSDAPLLGLAVGLLFWFRHRGWLGDADEGE